jgi:peptide/nickel transport system permease protein
MEEITLSPFKRVLLKLWKNKLAMFGGVLIIVTILFALLGYLIMPDNSPNANEMHLEISTLSPGPAVDFAKIENGKTKIENSFIDVWINGKESDFDYIPLLDDSTKNSYRSTEIIHRTYWLGTDRYGRDMLSRMILGTRVSLAVGLVSVIISMFVGVFLGAIAGYYGGKLDALISWLINVIWSLPSLLLVIAISFALGKGFWQVFIAIGLSMWVEVARLVRGQILSIKEVEYVEAAKALGYHEFRIIFRHILPNILGPLLVMASANFASAILLEAGLSFLGFGAQPPIPTWGGMVKEHYGYIIMDAAYLAMIPGLAIMMLVYAFNIFSSGIRDAFDQKN